MVVYRGKLVLLTHQRPASASFCALRQRGKSCYATKLRYASERLWGIPNSSQMRQKWEHVHLWWADIIHLVLFACLQLASLACWGQPLRLEKKSYCNPYSSRSDYISNTGLDGKVDTFTRWRRPAILALDNRTNRTQPQEAPKKNRGRPLLWMNLLPIPGLWAV